MVFLVAYDDAYISHVEHTNARADKTVESQPIAKQVLLAPLL
jgi:hypothetical protein